MKTILKSIIFIAFIAINVTAFAQVGINTNTPEASAALDVTSTEGGILIPRLTETQRDAITSPATGLMIFQTDQMTGFYFFDGAAWAQLEGPAGTNGTNGTDGQDGAQGIAGTNGTNGTDGTNGTNGVDGNDGAQGIQGETGATGPTGAAGTNGINGTDGQDGAAGLTTSVNGISQVDGAITLTTTNIPEGNNIYYTEALVSANNDVVANTAKTGMPTATEVGEMNYWNGTAWATIAPTTNDGATLQMTAGVPTWIGGTPPPPPAVGDFVEGGVLFYLFEDGDIGYVEGETHGLIAAVQDQANIKWHIGNLGISSTSTSIAIGAGSSNTDIIINAAINDYWGNHDDPTTYAAGMARAYTGGGYTDWFLPSNDELIKMYLNKTTINTTATENGGSSFAESYYYSSSAVNGSDAWVVRFTDGRQTGYGKAYPLPIRAVRAF